MSDWKKVGKLREQAGTPEALAWFRVRKPAEFWQAIRELRDGKVE